MASLEKPQYTVAILTKDGKKYDITKALTALILYESENGIAQRVTFKMVQLQHDGIWTTNLFNVHDQLYVFANTGSGAKEVFRGYIWTDTYRKDDTRELTFIAYDRLIYLQESEEYKYYSSGKNTKAVFQDICNDKGITLVYKHESITHPKLVLRGALSDAFENDLLEPVRKQTGKRGLIRDEQGKMIVFTEGQYNTTVYHFKRGEKGNILTTEHEETMEGITTKVVILGSEKDDKKAPIKATITGDTKNYGTIQKIITSTDSDKLADLKKEANQIIKDKGKPQLNINLTAIDNPWVRKGDKIYIEDGYRTCYATVISVEHDAMQNTMDLEVRKL